MQTGIFKNIVTRETITYILGHPVYNPIRTFKYFQDIQLFTYLNIPDQS